MLGLYAQAINHLDEAISLDPTFAESYHDRGLAMQKLGLSGSEAYFEMAEKLGGSGSDMPPSSTPPVSSPAGSTPPVTPAPTTGSGASAVGTEDVFKDTIPAATVAVDSTPRLIRVTPEADTYQVGLELLREMKITTQLIQMRRQADRRDKAPADSSGASAAANEVTDFEEMGDRLDEKSGRASHIAAARNITRGGYGVYLSSAAARNAVINAIRMNSANVTFRPLVPR